MKKLFSLYLFFFTIIFSAQTDYSSSWEDFYSYNNVKDFVKVENIIYALSDNAVFTFDVLTQEISKISSIQGLSGGTTSSIYYNSTFKRIVIGYKNGLVEIIDEDNTITISSDIVNFSQSGEKSINHISGFENTLYLSTPFAIVAYNIEKLEFGDTYFIGNGSSSIKINQTTIFDGQIYAATESGIFSADVTNDLLIDFNNWTQQFSGRNFGQITAFNNQLFTVEGTNLFSFDGVNLSQEKSYAPQNINAIKGSATHLAISLNTNAVILDTSLNEFAQFTTNLDFDFTLNTAFFENNTVYLATNELGILSTTASLLTEYLEIHPEGPLSNSVFSIAVQNNNLWVVYGGYGGTFGPIFRRQGYSHFNGENWINTKFNSNLPADLVNVTIDPSNENKVYISAFGVSNDINVTPTGGLLVVENDALTQTINHLNSSFEPIAISLPTINIRVSSSAFDSQGNLWATNQETEKELVKLSSTGQWTSIDLRSVQTSTSAGLNEIVIDNNNSVWIGTRRNGVYIYNENGDRKKALTTTLNSGSLPDLNVRAIAIDNNGRVWLGTKSGLVVYNNASGIFEEDISNANPIIIEENGVGEKLLGDQTVNSIAIDGAENKWFGTDNGGILYTNPNGQRTLANFSTQNSPLPSNRILKISIDDSTGKVYFATDKGIVAYDSSVAPFGDFLGEVYAYPNPALKIHETITIDGRNGTHLPKNTNVKILDVAGNLVYETNVVEGQELQGGKVVWDKKNLAGNKVASGIYIVLLVNDDASETSVTKIAIVN